MFSYLKSPWYATYSIVLFVASLMIFFWQSGFIELVFLPAPVRVGVPHLFDGIFSVVIAALITLFFTGLLYSANTMEHMVESAYGSSGGILGFLLAVLTLLCPVCNVGFFLIFGIGLNIAFLAPYLWIAQVISVALLTYSVWQMEKRIQSGFTCQL